MSIQVQHMSMNAGWGAGTMPPSGSMRRTTVSLSSPRILIFRNEVCYRGIRLRSSGSVPRIVPALKSKACCGPLCRSSFGSLRKIGNRVSSWGLVPRPNRLRTRRFTVPLPLKSSSLYYRARYYDSSAGRFPSEDLVGFSSGQMTSTPRAPRIGFIRGNFDSSARTSIP